MGPRTHLDADPSQRSRDRLYRITGVPRILNLATDQHTLALTPDGQVWAWGVNGDAQLGDGTTTDHLDPRRIAGLGAASAVAAGQRGSLAIVNGEVWTWAQITGGPLVTRPTRLMGLTNVVAISAGNQHYLAVTADGRVWS